MKATNNKERGWTAMTVRPNDLAEAKREAQRLGVKLSDFLAVLMRAWRAVPDNKKGQFIVPPVRETADA